MADSGGLVLFELHDVFMLCSLKVSGLFCLGYHVVFLCVNI